MFRPSLERTFRNRRFRFFAALAAGSALAMACGGGDDSNGGGDDDAGNGSDASTDASTDATVQQDAGHDGSTSNDGSVSIDASTDAGDAASFLICAPAATLIDTSHPDIVIGDGTPASCTSAALMAAFDHGGIVAFSCGSAPITIILNGDLRNYPGVDGRAALVL
ncbi:MAG: hypothetical protein ABI551_16000, partial [Polyangiaceae bacterium]